MLLGAECVKRECGGRGESLSCYCACPAHAPLFREDTGECANDITGIYKILCQNISCNYKYETSMNLSCRFMCLN